MKNSILILVFSIFFFGCKKEEAKEQDIPKPEVETPVQVKKEEIKEEAKLFFTVQIGAFSSPNNNYAQVPEVTTFKEDNLYKYRIGNFKTYREARNKKTQLLPKYPDAFVQAIKGQNPLEITKAINMQDN